MSPTSSAKKRGEEPRGAAAPAASKKPKAVDPRPAPAAYSLENPFAAGPAAKEAGRGGGLYEDACDLGRELIAKPLKGGGPARVLVQHSKQRMTVWERIKVLTDLEPNILWQNWGRSLDGASIVTGIVKVQGRDVAVYGHDFTLRAGSMDATNGAKLARLILMAAEHGIPLIGMNDSAGAFVPAGVGGLDGYSEAFRALRKVSGVVPSIMLMFGFNAGGGSYLPRQGSFMIQCEGTFFGLTGPAVVKSVLGEDISAEALGGPQVHAQTGVVDITTKNELESLRRAIGLLSYLPDNNHSLAPFCRTSDPIDRHSYEEEILLRRTFNSSTGMNTPFDITLYIQLLCDHGDYFELQPTRARNMITAFGRIGGYVVGFLANNSAVASGQIDIAAARKGGRFVRFCNLYNIPMIFLEDTTGFLPGKDQEHNGIVLEGRRLLDAIIDLRTPRITLIIRNAFGGAYATFNSHFVGADLVFALPTARIAVMGPAGREYVYKDELTTIQRDHDRAVASGTPPREAAKERDQRLAAVSQRYERELMNPKEALSLGSVSRIVMPGESRRVLAENLTYWMSRYRPCPMTDVQREFE